MRRVTAFLFASVLPWSHLVPMNAAESPAVEDEVHRERIEWCDMWVADANADARPKVLLVGDSITKGYYGAVHEALGKEVSVARLATSAFMADPAYIAQLDALLQHYTFDVIHFNNGLHGWAYSEKEYADALADALAHIRSRQPQATIVLANSTPLRERNKLDRLRDQNSRVQQRNRIMQEFAQAKDMVLNDLYSLVIDTPALWSGDGTHFGSEGRNLQGKAVAAVIRQALEKRER